MAKKISKKFFAPKASLVAPKLLGKKLCAKGCSALITEVEAYEGENDPASHAYKRTPRSAIMHDTYAHWYVYFIYGNHFCLNITAGDGVPGAVLIREVFPIKGLKLMKKRRFGVGNITSTKHPLKPRNIKDLCSGPGKLCQSFGINKEFNGLPSGKRLWIEEPTKEDLLALNTRRGLKHNKLCASPRVGISKGKNLKWRFRLEEK